MSRPNLTLRTWCLALVVLALPVLLYLPIAHGPLLGNDTPVWAADGQVHSAGDVGRLFLGPHFKYFRPVQALTFMVGAYPGQEAWGHAVDLALMYGILLAFFSVAHGVLGLGRGPSLALALLLGLHPIHEELLPFLARRGDLMVSLFSILYLGSVLKRRGVFPRAMWWFLAAGSKETAVLLLPAAALFEVLRDQGGLVGRVGRAARRFLPEAVLAVAYLWLRQRSGLSTVSPELTLWPLIPVDYLATIFLPHGWALWNLHPAAALALGGALTAALAILWCRRLSPTSILLLSAVALEILLYMYYGMWHPRRILFGTCLLLLWLAERLRDAPRRDLVLGLLLVLPFSLLHLASNPWQRWQTIQRAVQQQVVGVEQLVADRDPDRLVVLATDLPAEWQCRPLERRHSFSLGATSERKADWPLWSPTFVAKQWSLMTYPGRRLKLVPLVQVSLEAPDARVQTRRTVRGDGRVVLTLDLVGARAVLTPLAQPFTERDGDRLRVDLEGLRRVATAATLPAVLLHPTAAQAWSEAPAVLELVGVEMPR